MVWESEAQAHEYIGRFCVDFEQVCRSMESCIRAILRNQGLSNERLHEILLAGYTAEPLRRLLQSLVGETLAKKQDEQEICSRLFNKIQKLTSERNDIVHSKWFIVGLSKDDKVKVVARGEKLHSNKKGAATKEEALVKEILEAHIVKCREVAIFLSLLMRCLLGIRELTECFQVSGDNLIFNREALKPVEIERITTE